ncbi:MAG: DUF6600 domain-containing protein [Candidatus Korobacteraceae bacterium]
MKPRRRFEWLFTALLFVALGTGAAFAQNEGQSQDQGAYPPPPPDAQAQQNYPDQGAQQNYPDQGAAQGPYQQGAPQQEPSGRVARVQYMSGEVSTQPGGVNDWVAANTNRPLTTSDRIWTDKNSKAELNVGDGFLRMNSETSLTLTNVSDNTVQLELDQGTLSVTVRHLEAGEIYEVDTPNYAFTITKSGSYRFDVYPNEDQSWVTVRSGQGEATGKGAAVKVTSGQQVRFSSGNSLTHMAYAAPQRDGFDDWVQVRDKRLDDSLSARYVSPGVIGYQDLDANGQWAPDSPYGPVWTPTSVPAGWAPYRYGQWQWIAPWGWTWVDSASWGFAPFHYGRWVYWNNAWAWSPGPLGYWNPYYAPALVGWVGGPGFGIGFGWGGGWGWGGGFGIGIGFGWFPLGWGQPYYPHYCGWGHGGWYHGGGYVTGNYFRNVNITNTHINNINNISHNYYNNNAAALRNTNAIARNGVTSASKSAFTSGALVNKVGGAVPSSALNNAHLMNTANANPTHSSVTGGQPARTTGVPSKSVGSRSVVTRATPPSTRPATVESAAAHNNANSFGRGNTTSANNTAHETGANNAPRTAMNGANNAARPNTGTEAARGTTSANGSQARTPASSAAGNNVPRPPSAGGSTYNSANAAQSRNNVPRPPASNDSFARPSGNTANSAANRGSTTANNEHYGTSNSAANSASRVGGSQYSASRAGSASSVPRPPSSYQYHAAPSYSASSNYGRPSTGSNGYGASNRGYTNSYGAGRSSYGSTPGYSAGRSYSSNPGYSAGRSYGSTPNYSARSYGSSPSYSARSYSAPHNSGGSSYHSSGGGSSHGGGGGGSHGGGGGGHGGGGHR